MADAGPDALRAARDRLMALGFPADDLPDHLVGAVAGAVEDKVRLDWIIRRKVEVSQNGGRWALGWLRLNADHAACYDADLRAAIDRSRAASGAEEAARESRLAEMRAAAERSRAVREDLRVTPDGPPPAPDGRWLSDLLRGAGDDRPED